MSSDISVKTYNAECDYPITAPSGRVIEPPAGRCWRLSKKAFLERLQDNRIWFGPDGNGVPRIKRFLTDLKHEGMAPTSIMFFKDVGHSQEGAQEVSKLLDGGFFSGPKPQRLMQRLLTLANLKADSVVLDFFSGSASTAHAVMSKNAEDGGHRKFILVEMMDYADSITAERVKRVIKGYGEGKNAVEGTGGNFSFYDLGEPLLVGDCLNEAVAPEKIREYIWFMETKQPYAPPIGDNPYYLGKHNSTGYYFYYEPQRVTVLDYAFLSTITEKADGTVIYADRCSISEDKLAKMGVTFKKIPRDISRL